MTRSLALVLLLSGCELLRAPILGSSPIDGGTEVDAAFDAAGIDAPPVDAPTGEIDAPTTDLDAPPPTPDAPVPCLSRAEVCDGLDDDCDGAVDEDSTCQACTSPGSCDDCVRFVAGGRTYQSCPTVTPGEYWARICWTLGGRGYDLAVPNDATESDVIAAALRADTDIDDAHWIGVNDFETNGSWITVDGLPLGWAPSFSDLGAPRGNEGYAAIRADGDWDDYPTFGWELRVLCEVNDSRRRCMPSSTGTDLDDTCDTVDDDCDGFVDEDCAGPATCTSRVFWDVVHYACEEDGNYAAAKATCTAMTARVADLDHRFELELADDFADADTWIGLSQPADVPEPGGWAWNRGAFTPSDPDWTLLWAVANPTVDAAADCGFIKNSSARLEDHDCAMSRASTLCEAPL